MRDTWNEVKEVESNHQIASMLGGLTFNVFSGCGQLCGIDRRSTKGMVITFSHL